MKAIILSTTKYKEKDAIINAITKERYLTFKAHGILEAKNNNAYLSTPLTVAELTFSPTKNVNMMILKESTLISSVLSGDNDLEYFGYINLINETLKFAQEEEKVVLYEDILSLLTIIKNKNIRNIGLIKYFAQLLKATGFELNVNSCIRCNSKKDIIFFSFSEGGFICKDCLTNEDEDDLSRSQKILLRNILINKDYDFKNLNYQKEDVDAIFVKFIEFMQEAYGVKIKSVDAINTINK